MTRRFLFALAVLAITAPSAGAQTVDEIVAKHLEAEGGLEKLRAIQSYRYTGTATTTQGEAPYVSAKKRPNLTRTEFSVMGMTGIQAFDGKQGWAVMPFMGNSNPEPVPPDQQKVMERTSEFDEPLIDWKERGIQVELLGKQDVDGAPAWKLKVTRKDGHVETLYLDAETCLTMREEFKMNMRGTEFDGERILGDYRAVDGILFPFTIESGAVGMGQRRKVVMTKVEVNPPLDASYFAMPATAAAPADTSKAKPAKKGRSTRPEGEKKTG